MNQQRDQGQEQGQQQTPAAPAGRTSKLEGLFAMIRQRADEIKAVLPSDVPYQRFEACLMMAIRRDPDILNCYGPSIIRAAIQSAYDGLMPDGKQAVILVVKVKFKDPADGYKEKYRKEASYRTMVYGLRLKVVAAGAAKHVDGRVVHQNDLFEYEEGLEPFLRHKPIIKEEDRGPMIAVYARATLPDGEKTFLVMNRAEVMRVKACAQTKNVWEGPFEPEMWIKSAIRRLSKAIPTARPIRDAEAEAMFPQFGGQQPAIPDLSAPAPPRPQRSDFRQLGHHVELPLDLSAFGGEVEAVPVEEERAEAKPQRKQQSRKTPPPAAAADKAAARDQAAEPAREEGGESDVDQTTGGAAERSDPADSSGAAGPALPRPADQAGWEAWQTQVLAELGSCRKLDKLNALQSRERANIDAAPAVIARRVEGSFLDMRVDLQEKE